jgi:uncharacterized iron-regulated membrane protein
MDEINDAALPSREAAPAQPHDVRAIGVDHIAAASRERYPGEFVINISLDDEDPVAFVTMLPFFKNGKYDSKLAHWLKFDLRSGELINTSEQFKQDMEAPTAKAASTFIGVMRHLHIDLYAGLPGSLFLGFMALLFVVAIISGIALYHPFMKKLSFGTVRVEKARRVKWLDLHNLLGVTTIAWAVVVGLTDVQEAWAPWRGRTPPTQRDLIPVQTAVDVAKRAVPGMTLRLVSFPRPDIASAYHYLIWAKGNTPLTAHLSSAILVDAMTGELTRVLEMPWYLRALELSRPLHFGDYGGIPLKILWVLLDLVTIIVLASGLYLWITRRRQAKERLDRLVRVHSGQVADGASV